MPALTIVDDTVQKKNKMYDVTLIMTDASGQAKLTRRVELKSPPRAGALINGVFGNATLAVTRSVLDGNGDYIAYVAVSLLDLVPIDAIEHIANKSGWVIDDPFEEDTAG